MSKASDPRPATSGGEPRGADGNRPSASGGKSRGADGNGPAVRRVVLIILVLNLLVAAAKGVYAALSGSLAVATDAIHSALDASSNIVGMIALRMAQSPPDEGHPYGHRKVEILATVAIGVAIGVAAFRFASSAVVALWEGRPSPTATTLGFAVILGTLVTNIFVAVYEHRRGRQLQSSFLVADAMHTASDVAVTIAVLISMVAARAGVTWADPVAALVVTLVIARVAWSILSANLGILLDRAALPAEEIRAVALATPGVVGCHRVRSRGANGAYELDLHVQVDGAISLAAAHAISHAVEARLKETFEHLNDVTIHIEPDDDVEEPI
jgi:cation diffusion facilitator family transporter